MANLIFKSFAGNIDLATGRYPTGDPANWRDAANNPGVPGDLDYARVTLPMQLSQSHGTAGAGNGCYRWEIGNPTLGAGDLATDGVAPYTLLFAGVGGNAWGTGGTAQSPKYDATPTYFGIAVVRGTLTLDNQVNRVTLGPADPAGGGNFWIGRRSSQHGWSGDTPTMVLRGCVLNNLGRNSGHALYGITWDETVGAPATNVAGPVTIEYCLFNSPYEVFDLTWSGTGAANAASQVQRCFVTARHNSIVGRRGAFAFFFQSAGALGADFTIEDNTDSGNTWTGGTTPQTSSADNGRFILQLAEVAGTVAVRRNVVLGNSSRKMDLYANVAASIKATRATGTIYCEENFLACPAEVADTSRLLLHAGRSTAYYRRNVSWRSMYAYSTSNAGDPGARAYVHDNWGYQGPEGLSALQQGVNFLGEGDIDYRRNIGVQESMPGATGGQGTFLYCARGTPAQTDNAIRNATLVCDANTMVGPVAFGNTVPPVAAGYSLGENNNWSTNNKVRNNIADGYDVGYIYNDGASNTGSPHFSPSVNPTSFAPDTLPSGDQVGLHHNAAHRCASYQKNAHTASGNNDPSRYGPYWQNGAKAHPHADYGDMAGIDPQWVDITRRPSRYATDVLGLAGADETARITALVDLFHRRAGHGAAVPAGVTVEAMRAWIWAGFKPTNAAYYLAGDPAVEGGQMGAVAMDAPAPPTGGSRWRGAGLGAFARGTRTIEFSPSPRGASGRLAGTARRTHSLPRPQRRAA